MSKKLLIVCPSFGNSKNGAGRFVELIQQFSEYDITVLTHNANEAEGVINIPINLNFFQRKLTTFSLTKYFLHRIHEIHEQFDLIVFNTPLILYGLSPMVKNYIVFIHDDNFCNLEFSWSKNYLIRKIYRSIEKRALKSAPAIVVNSKYLENVVIKEYGVDKSKISILYQGIRIDDFTYSGNRLWHDTIKILFIKGDAVRGQITRLIQVLSSLREYQFELTICGSLVNVKLPKTRKNVRLNIEGLADHEMIKQHLRTHHIYCLPVLREALGVSNMEAMASGIPIVVSRVGGVPEVLTSREAWLIDTPINNQNIRNALLQCIRNPHKSEMKAKYARERVSKFDFKHIVQKFDEIVTSFLMGQ